MKSSRWKNLLKNLGLSAASLLLCFAFIEGVLRISGYGNLEIYEPHPVLYWRLKPNQDCYTKVDRKPVHINSHGTRGPEFTAAKPADTIRVVSLGDSRTFGWGLTESEAYSGLLQNLLQERVGSGKRVEVINAGVNAWSFPQMLVYFREYALKYQPDYVIVADANLWTQFSEKSSPEFVRKFLFRVRLKNILRRFAAYHYFIEVKLREVYERQRTRFIPVDPEQDNLFKEQQQKDPDAVFRDAIEQLCRVALTNKVQPVLLYIPRLDELNLPEPARVLRAKTQVSKSLNVPLIDMTTDVVPHGNKLYLDADPVHFNVAGNKLIAERLVEAIATVMRPVMKSPQ